MYWLYITRIVVLSWAAFCGIVLLGLGGSAASADWTWGTEPAAPGIAIAVGVLSLLTLPVMIILDFVLSNVFFTSWVIVEVVWLLFLSILYLAAGAAAASFTTCISTGNTCTEIQAAAAFGFLAWLPVMAYAVTLLVFSILAQNRGGSVWTTAVKEADFSGGASAPSTQYKMGAVSESPAPGMQQV